MSSTRRQINTLSISIQKVFEQIEKKERKQIKGTKRDAFQNALHKKNSIYLTKKKKKNIILPP